MNKHTPAPWKIARFQKTEDTHHHEVLARDTEYHREVVICECFPINDDGQIDSESAANARLIAAAPDLLAALQSLENLTNLPAFRQAANKAGYMAQFSTAKAAARAAIAKVEG